ncbi:ABC transporter permease [Fibrella sp. HMF5036]|uniref:ABC transporter permease n=2 Tax=Fibrella aquatilis TaxID=2817059 RepID=A0A939G8Z1_9BACT|nr:ABC transporter permease [Fibrella aquatilis]
MLRNYLKIAWRNLVRSKTFSTINVLGLALGMASSLLIWLWVQDELRIGTQYPSAQHLHRVMEHEIADGRIVTDEDTPGLLADELKRVLPEVVYAANMAAVENVLMAGTVTTRQKGLYAGADWFRLYDVPLLEGTTQTANSTPGSIAISENVAKVYFGGVQQAIGKTLRFDDWQDCRVTAVFANLPANAPEKYDYVRNWQDFLRQEQWLTHWENSGPTTRVQLRPEADVAKVNAKLKTFLKGRNKDINANFNIELFLQPETEAYLYGHFRNGQRDGGRIEYVRMFVGVAVFLLLIAAINFMNLATARSAKRAREVGVRKVVGAGRASLIGQFMGETFLLALLALGLAVIAVAVVLPSFNTLTEKRLVMPLASPESWAMWLGLAVVVGALAGSYPALFLSSLSPVRVLKSALRVGAGAQQFRRGLVVFQFVLSMVMIVGTLVIYRQLHYIQQKNLGFDRANLISLSREGALIHQYQQFKERLSQMPGIQQVTFLKSNPLYNGSTSDGVRWPGKDPTVAIQFNNTSVGYDFVKTMNLKLVQGRDFSPAYGADSSNYLINEAAARRMGFANPVGKPLTFWGTPGTIIGVLKDFHFNSLHVAVRPLIVRLIPVKQPDAGVILVRPAPGQTEQALQNAETLWREMNPKFPFNYGFVDDDFARQYRNETIVGTLTMAFACLAIFIACLGLFGLATFTAEQRTKEIGIRKVLGASITSIIALLNKEFLKLVLIAVVLASPLAGYVMSRWLEGFAYRIELTWWMFALAGTLAILIALLTVSFQSLKAALVNPVKSLQSE